MTQYKFLEPKGALGSRLYYSMTIMSDRKEINISVAISIIQIFQLYMNAKSRVLSAMDKVSFLLLNLKRK